MDEAGDDPRPWLRHYPRDVPATVDVRDAPLTALLDDAATGFPSSAAISYAGSTLTYRDLHDDVARLADGLASLGIGVGDRVAILLPNCPQWPTAFFAVLRLGAVAVPADPLTAPNDLRTQLSALQVTTVVCHNEGASTVDEVRDEVGLTSIVVASPDDYARGVTRVRRRLSQRVRPDASGPSTSGTVAFRDLVRPAAPSAAPSTVVPPEAPAVLQATGGTTGPPKTVVLSHRNLLASAQQLSAWLVRAKRGREITIAALPLFHLYGLTTCLLTPVALAARIVLLPRFDAELALDAIDRERPTMFPVVPPMFQRLLDAPETRRHDLRSLRTCVMAMMPCPDDVHERFERVIAGAVVTGYAATETGGLTHCNPVLGDRYLGTIGLPLPSTDARIIDVDTGEVLPPGQAGELAVRGPQVSATYDGDTPRAQLDDDGWYRTGDVAVMDDKGYFTMLARRQDLVRTADGDIAPSYIEQVIRALPGVADCCVIAPAGRGKTRRLTAYVVMQPGATRDADEILRHASDRLAPHAVPASVVFRDRLPRSVLGNALRHELAAEAGSKTADTTD